MVRNHVNPLITFSLDGVQESKSSITSMDTYCIKFEDCRNIYPIKLIRPNERYKYNDQEELAELVGDINNSGMIINTGVFDNPKRSMVTMTKTCAARHGCEYCEAPAVTFKDNSMTKSHLTWPPATMNGRPRTITGIRRIVNEIEENNGELPRDYVKGIKGRSIFLNQPNFHIIFDIPTEYMHLVCLGNIKKLLEFTYKVGKQRHVVTKIKRLDPNEFNVIIVSVKVVREFSRRCRNLDTSVYKAQEYRNVLLFFFPVILKNIPDQNKKHHQIWLSLVYMIRACVIPNEEFDQVSKPSIVNSCELYYNLFHELFGQRNCTYSVHTVSSHLMKVRGDVPLTQRSAFYFESFYSEMRQMFKPGTSTPLKQILTNSYMKRSIEFHKCEKTIFYSKEGKTETQENNSIIYTFQNNTYEFYVIQEITDNVFICKRQGKFEYHSTMLPALEWKKIGVFRQGAVGTQIYRIQKNEVKGKVINVLNMLITCPINVLNEK